MVEISLAIEYSLISIKPKRRQTGTTMKWKPFK